MPKTSRPLAALVLPACLFVSGGASLAYEVSWAKYLAFFVGSTAIAHTVVLATFMGGLAGGAWLFGRWADKVKNPLRLYGCIELGISIIAFLFPWLMEWAGSLYLWSAAPFSDRVELLIPLRVALAVLVIAVPSILMGGTLPAVARFYVQSFRDVGSDVGRLYFVNALGAVLGCIIAGFLLIPSIGIVGTIWAGVVANLIVALTALGLSFHTTRAPSLPAPKAEEEAEREVAGEEVAAKEAPRPASAADEESPFPLWVAWVALLATGASGAASMTYEIVWIRMLTLVMGGSAYAFTTMLAAFILGIALGSLLVAWKKTGIARSGLGAFGALEVGVAFVTVLSIPLYSRLPYFYMSISRFLERDPDNFGVFLALGFLVCLATMLVPTVLLGATFPLAARLATRSMKVLGQGVGRTYAFNTAGTVFGTIFAAHLFLPKLGLQGTIILAAAVNLIAGLGCLLGAWRTYEGPVTRAEGRKRAALIGMMTAILVVMVVAPPRLDSIALNRGIFRSMKLEFSGYGELSLWARSGVEVLYHSDGSNGTVMVMQSPSARFMNVNGKTDASDGGDITTQFLGGHLPALIHPDPRKALVVGLGSGATVGALLAHEDLEVLCLELSKEIVEAARLFDHVNGNMFEHPRAKVVIEDAGAYMELSRETYDIIVSIPSNPWVQGNGSLFTAEFFDLVMARLGEDGIFVQWFHDYEMTADALETILRTAGDSFPNIALFSAGALNDYLMVASKTPVDWDADRIDERLKNNPTALGHLSTGGIRSHKGIFARHLFGREDLIALAGSGPLQTRRRPVLEYQAPVGVFLSSHPDLLKAYDRRRVPESRRGLLLDRVLQENPDLTDEDYEEILAAVGGPFFEIEMSMARDWALTGREAGIRRYARVLHARADYRATVAQIDRLVELDLATPEDLLIKWDSEILRVITEGAALSPTSGVREAMREMHAAAEQAGTAEAYELLGRAEWRLRRYGRAAQAYERAISVEPDLSLARRLDLLTRAAEAWRLHGDLQSAGASVEAIFDLEPTYYRGHLERYRLRAASASVKTVSYE